mgnify:CR=1 FL=1
MCLGSPKMPKVETPVAAAPPPPPAPSPEIETELTDAELRAEKLRKRAKGKKGLRYKPTNTSGTGLQILKG